jgi:hypothetical protein
VSNRRCPECFEILECPACDPRAALAPPDAPDVRGKEFIDAFDAVAKVIEPFAIKGLDEAWDRLRDAARALAPTPPDALREAARRVLSAPLHMEYGPTGEFTPCRCEACAALRAAIAEPKDGAVSPKEEKP